MKEDDDEYAETRSAPGDLEKSDDAIAKREK